MINAILIDDETHCNASLRYELTEYCPKVHVLAEFTSPEDAILGIQKLQPDLLFLDIEMPWMTGFELLQKVKSINFDVIFITAYDSYALEAFRYSAIDYLLKPIDTSLLQEAVNKVVDKKKHRFSAAHLEALVHNLSNENKSYKIVLPTSEGLEIVNVEEIVHCKAENNYTHIYLKDDTSIFLSKSLKEIEQTIRSPHFIRVHQSHLVNKNFIKKFIRKDGGYLLLEDGSEISVSKSNKEKVMQILKNW